MNSIKIVFFDTTWSQLIRFGSKIASLIKANNPNVYTIGVVSEAIPNNDNSRDTAFDLVYDNRSDKDIAQFVTVKKPDILVVVQNTVQDQNVILRAKKVGAMVFVLQHGMLYVGASLNNFNLRESFAAILNLKKTLWYLVILKHMCDYDSRSYLKLIKKIATERNDVARIVQNHFSVKLNGDYAMVIGEHWIDYYCEHYDYRREEVFLMGNHDVDGLELGKPLEDAICYIPSVHVEDGKVRESVFMKFVKALADSVDIHTKFYIKMHPRGNDNLYKEAFKNHNVTFIHGPELPYVKTYIGHNSTLLAKALMITDKVILWRFKEEKELFYIPWAYAVCNKPSDLKEAVEDAVNGKKRNEERKDDLSKISYINPQGAFDYAAVKIMELYNQKTNR